MSGEAERRRRTTRRGFRKTVGDIVVRRMLRNVGYIFLENIVNIPGIKNRSQREFPGQILNYKRLCMRQFNIGTFEMICLE